MPAQCASLDLQVVTSQVPVDPAKDKVEVNGKKLDLSTAGKQHFYFAVNKPKVRPPSVCVCGEGSGPDGSMGGEAWA